MGYYSSVAIGMSYDNYIKGLKYMKERGIDDNLNYLLPENCTTIFKDNNDIIIYYSSVKWYNWCIDELRTLYRFLSTIPYALLRIGEESGDIEFEGELSIYDFEVYPYTYLEFEFNTVGKEIKNENIIDLIKDVKPCYLIFPEGVGKYKWKKVSF